MCEFWQAVLRYAAWYQRTELSPQVDLAATVELTAAHFTRWLGLWTHC
jgi:hypothetical protein